MISGRIQKLNSKFPNCDIIFLHPYGERIWRSGERNSFRGDQVTLFMNLGKIYLQAAPLPGRGLHPNETVALFDDSINRLWSPSDRSNVAEKNCC